MDEYDENGQRKDVKDGMCKIGVNVKETSKRMTY